MVHTPPIRLTVELDPSEIGQRLAAWFAELSDLQVPVTITVEGALPPDRESVGDLRVFGEREPVRELTRPADPIDVLPVHDQVALRLGRAALVAGHAISVRNTGAVGDTYRLTVTEGSAGLELEEYVAVLDALDIPYVYEDGKLTTTGPGPRRTRTFAPGW